MRGPVALAGLLLVSSPLAGLADEAPPRVPVRIEGNYEQLWSGEVQLPPTFQLTATSGKVYALDARTPLGALAAASRAAGLALEVTDEYADFKALSVAGEYWFGTTWWDYRVNWVQTSYGEQSQWLAWGPPLQEGDAVLWYVEGLGTAPLRMTDLAPLPGACARPELVEVPALDVQHQPGQPWPSLQWRPAHLARLAGGASGPVVAGVGVAVGSVAGWVWAEEHPLPASLLQHFIRSPRSWLPCP